ncbi:hypothetical protein [Pseudorhodoplanes sp.]|uniref:hypothetical protein n=1 Tax=Pseudorhodoplanes sp. TaxID=1934341 RepID=UPI003D0CB4E7
MQIQPDRVRIKFRDNGVVLVDGGGETAVYVASLLSDLACEQAFHNGSGVVVAHHVRYPGFGLGLPKLVTAKCGAKASCTISTGTQIQGCVIDEDVFRVEAATTRIRAETGTIIVVVADGAARKPRAVVDRTVLRKGIEIDQALWDAAFARSLSVLLPRKRRLVDYIGST